MRKQVQFNGLWQSTATGVIRYADTEHGVLWERTLEDTREVWRQLSVSKSHVRGYLQAQSENGWQMVGSNRDAAREPEAFAAWYGDMFPHGVPLRVREYSCDVKHAVMAACETDAANGWIVDARGAVHALTPEEREMIRLTMAMDAMNDSWELDAADVVEPDMGEPEPAPRVVGSAPQLPAECSAVTQEIPEVPPQVNNQARVLKVSEHVIPTGQKVAGGEMFPDVSYRSVHAFTVAVLDDAGNVVKRKKVAYAFRHHGMVHVVRRDRYELAGRDATVEAEIAEFVAKLQKAA
ncbi:hypothetical protein PG2048B_0780 [Bifidobacterium pseudolongum subsp. globosum]|uniref:hypothetical protein n=1 Tax=Bifidobacterium pseudolongum TaxID=1694 RepID=UPI00101F2FF6|nr:hypothetical protein [Bifidobacterium pseudolongum]RYQ24478.1 hypothetical protein PG2048B_0780 [Bifidobacterium pseudolongum subsp. globosum]